MIVFMDRPDSTSGKTFASGAATLMCGPWRKATEMGTAHSWHPKGY